MKRLAVTGGLVVAENSAIRADVFIENGKISAVRPPSKHAPKADIVIDARGKTVIPGVIDAHVHFSLPAGDITTSDDFSSGSHAAIAGGVTTVIDYTTQPPGIGLERAARARLAKMRGKMRCDYSLHCIIPSWTKLKNPARQMKTLCRMGIPSFKMFMIYGERGMQSGDADLHEAMLAAKACGATLCLHAESDGIIRHLSAKHAGEGMRGFVRSRPDFSEWEAVQRALVWAEAAGAKVYFVHLSAGRSARIITAARAAGIHAMGETCPQYLALDQSALLGKNGHFYATCPQVKTKKDSALLWQALKEGAVSTIATDSCTFNSSQKNRWRGDFSRIPFGIPGVETSIPLIYTLGVLKNRISLLEMTRMLSLNPAKIMGLYPRKGAIRPGADADLAILDTKNVKAVDHAAMQTNCDWNPYQGMKLKGWAETVILRGEIAARNGAPVSAAPEGVFLPRRPGAFI
ncbi:MAG: dihydropyrimidinase [Elusimicrobiales bacterium]